MSTLLDANVLIALAVEEHVHHRAAEEWFVNHRDSFASCPITQGSLLRILVRGGRSGTAAVSALERLLAHDRHEFWPDDLPYTRIRMSGVLGHRQVTDAYLAGLARARAGRLVTFDAGLAATHPDVVDRIPTS